jgi:hypothetical protein
MECAVFEWKWRCAWFLSFVYRYISIGDPVITGVGLEPRHMSVQALCVVFCWGSVGYGEIWWFGFVDIGRIVDRHRLLTDFVCLYNYEFWLSLCKIVRSSVILLLPLFKLSFRKSLPCVSKINVPALTYNLESNVVVHNLELYIFNIHEKSLKIPKG